MTEITGNTYPVRDKLKALGARWDAARKCWIVADNKADEARALIPAESAVPAGRHRIYPSRQGSRVCKDCGCKINYGVYCGKCEYR
jgi:hypothetical protein